MSYEYQNFATLGVNLNRQKYGSLDISSVFASRVDFEYYRSKGTVTTYTVGDETATVSDYWLNTVPYPYEGQIVSVVDDAVVYVYKLLPEVDGVHPYEEVGSATAGDNATIVLNDKILSLKNFGDCYYTESKNAETGAIDYTKVNSFKEGLVPRVINIGTEDEAEFVLAWIEPSTEVANNIAAINDSIENSYTIGYDTHTYIDPETSEIVEGESALEVKLANIDNAGQVGDENILKSIGGGNDLGQGLYVSKQHIGEIINEKVDNVTIAPQNPDAFNMLNPLEVKIASDIPEQTTEGETTPGIQNLIEIVNEDENKGLMVKDSAVREAVKNNPEFTGTMTAEDVIVTSTVTVPTPVNDTDATNKKYVDDKIDSSFAANDAMVFKGTIKESIDAEGNTINEAIEATVTTLPIEFSAGWTYRAVTPITTFSPLPNIEIGDLIIAIKDHTAEDSDITNPSEYWTIVQSNIDGAVTTDNTGFTPNNLIVAVTPHVVRDAGVTLTDINATISDSHIHSNKPQLDSYDKTQTELLDKAKEDAGALDDALKEELQGLIDEKGESGVYVGSGDMPDNCNIQIDPTGNVFDINNVVTHKCIQNLVSDTLLTKNNIVTVLGYYEENDGGYSSYIIGEKGDIQLDNGLYAQILITPQMRVECFGAIGDGITDDSTAIALGSSYDTTLVFGNKTYCINTPISLNNSIKWVGTANTVIKIDDNIKPDMSTSYSAILVLGCTDISNITFSHHSTFYLEDTEVGKPAGEYPSLHIIRVNKGALHRLKNVNMYITEHTDIPYKAEVVPIWYNLDDSVVHNLYVDNCTISNLTTGHDTGTGCLWIGCFTNNNPDIGIYDNVIIENSVFIRNHRGDVVTISSNNSLMDNILIDNCVFNITSDVTSGASALQFGASFNYPTKFNVIKVHNTKFNVGDGFGAGCIGCATSDMLIDVYNCSFYKDCPQPKYYKVIYDEDTGVYTATDEQISDKYGNKVTGVKVIFEGIEYQVYAASSAGTTIYYIYNYLTDNLDNYRRLQLINVQDNSIINFNHCYICSASSMLWTVAAYSKNINAKLYFNNCDIYSYVHIYNAADATYRNSKITVGNTATNVVFRGVSAYKINLELLDCIMDAGIRTDNTYITFNNSTCNYPILLENCNTLKAYNNRFNKLIFKSTGTNLLEELILSNNIIDNIELNYNGNSITFNDIASFGKEGKVLCVNNYNLTNRLINVPQQPLVDQLILSSPNGTKYIVSISDEGTLQANLIE